jgi:hypothetical protein
VAVSRAGLYSRAPAGAIEDFGGAAKTGRQHPV